MYYIVQENTFRERNYDNLVKALERLKLPYEIVQVLPFIETVKFKTTRKDVFPFGAIKLARVSKQYGWYPGSQMNENHDFMVYKDYYKENLLNYDSKIIKFGDKEFFSKERFFARPTADTKMFTGRQFDMKEWRDNRKRFLKEMKKMKKEGLTVPYDENTEIQITSIKKIQQEIRFWIVQGRPVTASTYRLGNQVLYSEYIDQAGWDFCQKMVDIFQLNEAFVMDLALVDGEFKIIECGCINCAGFYAANMQKLLIELENTFGTIERLGK